MASKIIDSGILPNEAPGMKQNPRECELYTHLVKQIRDDLFVQTISWELQGDYPQGLQIAEPGIISGRIKPYAEQPAIDNSYPGKTPPFSGGLDCLPGSQLQTFTFSFQVVWKFMEWTSSEKTSQVPKTETATVQIMEIKNNNITNVAFVRAYLKAGKTHNPNVKVPGKEYNIHTFGLGGKTYTYENVDEFLQVHPGPFLECKA